MSDSCDRTVDGSHDQTLENLDVLSMVLAALRRDLAGNPWFDNMKEPARSALTAAVVVSLEEILPGFATYAKATAVERRRSVDRGSRGPSLADRIQVDCELRDADPTRG